MSEENFNLSYLKMLFDEEDLIYLLPGEEEAFHLDLPEETEEELEDAYEVEETEPEEVVEVPKVEEKKAERSTAEGYKFFGENKRKILVLLEYSQGDLLKSKEFDLLLKIMGSINLTLHEFAVVNLLKNDNVTFEKLCKQFEPSKMLYFSSADESFLIEGQLLKYQPLELNGVEAIVADSLTQMLVGEEAVEKKKALWQTLKAFFLKRI
ncbi:hypothetical protein V6R21_22245 [Limibacter armeniacum]|uniref:hypothetical protein n=1 Tax=Limibacter armeniacum TaxID=466084 RepID=UPI002FE6BF43